MSTERVHPLFRLWLVFSTATSILSLSSLAENIVAWNGFIYQVVASYKNLIYPTFNLIFDFIFLLYTWYPLDIKFDSGNGKFYDILLIDIILLSTLAKIRSSEVEDFASEKITFSEIIFITVIIFLLFPVFFPLAIIVAPIAAIIFFIVETTPNRIILIQWILFYALVLFILVFINALL